LPPEEWKVSIHDHHPAYLTWERYLVNQAKLAENRPRRKMNENRGAIREGLALLVGLLRCGQCGRRIYVTYRDNSALYYCNGGPGPIAKPCFSFGSRLIDERVAEELCRALQPLSIEAALRAATKHEEHRNQEIEHAELQVQAAQYEADRAFEQYDLVDPKNRLVADTLEARLNRKLVALQEAKQRLDALRETQAPLTDEQRQHLHDLARDFPSVWNHPQADPKLKKRLLRAAIREILVTCHTVEESGGEDQEQAGRVDVARLRERQRLEVTIHWQGGTHTRFELKRRATPRRRGGATDPDLVDTVRKLVDSGLGDAEVARILSMQKLKTPRGLAWNQDRVRDLRNKHRIQLTRPLSKDEYLTQGEVATYLGVSRKSVLALERLGAISRNQITDFAPWRVPRVELDSDRVQSLVRVLKETGTLPKGGCSDGQTSLFGD
jgi:hypothetical protein